MAAEKDKGNQQLKKGDVEARKPKSSKQAKAARKAKKEAKKMKKI